MASHLVQYLTKDISRGFYVGSRIYVWFEKNTLLCIKDSMHSMLYNIYMEIVMNISLRGNFLQ